MENKINYSISKRETELMEMLWKLKRPMTSVEMLAEDWPRSWKDNYLTIMLHSLEDKGLITVCGLSRQGKAYCRQFIPTMKKVEYLAKSAAARIDDDGITDVMIALSKEKKKKFDSEQFTRVIAAMAKNEDESVDDDFLHQLEDIVKGLKEG